MRLAIQRRHDIAYKCDWEFLMENQFLPVFGYMPEQESGFTGDVEYGDSPLNPWLLFNVKSGIISFILGYSVFLSSIAIEPSMP
jgi:hypothetical protein